MVGSVQLGIYPDPHENDYVAPADRVTAEDFRKVVREIIGKK